MDTQTDSSALDVNQAAAAFATLDEPTEAVEEQGEPQAERETPGPQEEGDDAQPEEASEEPEEQAKTVPVVIDGKTVEVPLSEVVASYQKDKAAAERFEAAAAMRKEAQAETAKAQQERQQYASGLHQANLRLEAVLQEQAQTDWNALAANDPAKWVEQRNLFDQRQAAYQQNAQQLQALQAQQAAEQAQAHQAYVIGQHQALLEKLPAWKDEAKANAERQSLKTYLKSEGYDDGAIGGLSDHKTVLLARKAMLYDQMIAKASAATKKVAALPAKVERPGVTEIPASDKRSQVYKQAIRTGRIEDFGKAFATLL